MFNKIHNVNVWGLKESLMASGYPMTHGETPVMDYIKADADHKKRAINLGNAKAGSGHDCFLKGIVVQFDWRISQVIFPQVERYHFIDIVSSQSKMHRIQLAKREDFNENVDFIILNRFMELVEDYNNEDNPYWRKQKFDKVVYSCPMGYELTARFTTNYLQLKTIYFQRRHHKLEEWREFCQWIESLPMFKELVLKDEIK